MARTVRFTNCAVYTPWEVGDSLVFSDRVVQVGGGLRGDVEVDLHGAIVAPGFVDAHVHLRSTAFKLATVDLQGMSRGEVVAHLRSAAPTMNGWVYARGWDESFWGEGGYLTPDEIDNNNPVLAVRVDGHMGVLNRRGMSVAAGMGVQVSPDGLVKENELVKLETKVTEGYNADEYLKKAQDYCLERGVVAVCDIARPEAVEYYLKNPPKIRVVFSPIGIVNMEGWRTGVELAPNLYVGFTKLFADGSIGARTAAVSSGYADGVGDPRLFYTDEQLEALYTSSLGSGMEVMTHAIGDLAVAQVVRVSKRFKGRRLRVEHNELAIPESLEGDEVGLVCSMQPNFLQWSACGGLYERRLGSYAISSNNHFRCLVDRGVKLAFGSDSMPLDPAYGIRLVLNPPHPKQKLNLQEAITCYTYNSAYANRLETLLGSLEVGKPADLIVLEASPKLRVTKTYLGGVRVK
ncbi:MAG: amidohydrolase family protein [Thermoprotei archaeon]